MELVKQKGKNTKLRETRLGVFAFICALLTLAYFNVFLITLQDFGGITSFFFLIVPTIGIVSAIASFARIGYKKTFAWWALGLYLFMVICIVTIVFFEFTIYPKP